jgi:hypothetical protein
VELALVEREFAVHGRDSAYSWRPLPE